MWPQLRRWLGRAAGLLRGFLGHLLGLGGGGDGGAFDVVGDQPRGEFVGPVLEFVLVDRVEVVALDDGVAHHARDRAGILVADAVEIVFGRFHGVDLAAVGLELGRKISVHAVRDKLRDPVGLRGLRGRVVRRVHNEVAEDRVGGGEDGFRVHCRRGGEEAFKPEHVLRDDVGGAVDQADVEQQAFDQHGAGIGAATALTGFGLGELRDEGFEFAEVHGGIGAGDFGGVGVGKIDDADISVELTDVLIFHGRSNLSG